MSDYLELFRQSLESRENRKDRDSKILIIDGLNMWIRTWSAIPVLSSSGDHVGAVAGYLKSIGSIIRQFDPTRVIIAFDGSGGSLRRRKVFSDYKSNRTPKIHQFKKEFSSLEEERESMKFQVSRSIEYLDRMPLTFVRIDHIEADDTIANIVNQYYDSETDITVVSTDRDFLQLITNTVKVWNPIRKILYDPEKIKEEYGLLPENYLLYRILTGDNSDAIPGISGLGLKTLLKEYPLLEKKISIEEFIEMTVRKSEAKKPKKFVSEILSNQDKIKLNSQLMQLTDVDISLHSKNQIRDLLDMKIPTLKRGELIRMAYKDGIVAGNWNFENWLSNTFDSLNIWASV
jgi:DNA polymerase-1